MFGLDLSLTFNNGLDRFCQKLWTVLCRDMSYNCRRPVLSWRRFEHCCPLRLSFCPHIYLRGKKACRPFAFSFTCLLQAVFSSRPLFSNAANRMAGCVRLCGLLTRFLSAEIRPVLGTNRVTSSLCQLRFHFTSKLVVLALLFSLDSLSLLVWENISFVGNMFLRNKLLNFRKMCKLVVFKPNHVFRY